MEITHPVQFYTKFNLSLYMDVLTDNATLCRKVNCLLTKKVIELHSLGYEFDFRLLNKQEVICLQDDRKYHSSNTQVKVIDQVFDFLSHSYKYIHTVDTGCGTKGLLIIEGIYICGQNICD
jgi:hypothetical protein